MMDNSSMERRMAEGNSRLQMERYLLEILSKIKRTGKGNFIKMMEG